MQFFHVLNRGVDKRDIFVDDQDRFRFIHGLFEYNDENPSHTNYSFKVSRESGFQIKKEKNPRDLLVDIHAFCLMGNHYHLLLTSRVEDGVSKFMRKLNVGYSKYFNNRHGRQGSLFESRYDRIKVDDEPHFIHLPYYIHMNPLDFSFPSWREEELEDLEGALNFLRDYRWSSHLDYLGGSNFPSVTNRQMFSKVFGGPEGYKKSYKDWLKSMDVENFKGLVLE